MKNTEIDTIEMTLPNVSSKRGAPMGRRNTLPTDTTESIKFRMIQLNLVDGDYDKGGAYWGYTIDTKIYFAKGISEIDGIYVEIFTRAANRKEAKFLIREIMPNARFYR